ncbi:MAG TPA: class I SAM-dependent methyltransferase [Sphingopyxis sp.]|nr:class I SAM-dependent methyltransferase [Sphingopyxis sp.]HMP43907.1 class I SAM-dependent methyltransferase [Sphingopyxis sp.]HMQ18074.1 class I SAM-dependent methyltransferase [Sphingopyxis sp.]
MNHFYFSIPGWFGFEDIYREAVDRYDGIFVEVGAWKGRSTAFLAVTAIRSGKPIDIHVVDTFEGSDEEAHRADPDIGDLRAVFECNVAPVRHRLTVWQMRSVAAAALFDDASLDFVLLDGAHDHDSVRADIAAWLPKIRPGGWLCGDDIDWGTDRPVRRAVDAMLPGWERRGCAWSFEVQERAPAITGANRKEG